MRLEKLDLNLLMVLDAVLVDGNVSRAAVRLNLTQPAVSNALARLRAHFEDDLFVPMGRRMVPTDLARRLAGPVSQFLQQARSISSERSGFDPASSNRRFIFAVSDYEAMVFMPEVARYLHTQAPGVTLSLRTSLAHSQLEAPNIGELLQRRGNDFVVLPEPLASDDHPQACLYQERYLSIVWRGNKRVADTLTRELFFDLPHVVAEFVDNRAASFEQPVIDETGIGRNVAVAVEHFSIIPEYIEGTDRIATLHSSLARLLARRYDLRVFPVPIDLPPLNMVVQWNRGREKDAATQWMLSILLDVARRFPA
jgi:LysR family transcriptional regulator, nod-box dependent transcriptional activator